MPVASIATVVILQSCSQETIRLRSEVKLPNRLLLSPSLSSGTQTCISLSAISIPAAFGLTIASFPPSGVLTIFAFVAIVLCVLINGKPVDY